MRDNKFFIVILVILCFGCASAAICDTEIAVTVHDGFLGQSGDFKWLGLLQVYIRDFDKRPVSMTGIVLIKPKYALANANDVAKIPEQVFKQDTVAVFIPAENTPCAVSVLSFVLHPEYGDSVVHSFAVVELNNDEIKDYALKPVCLPKENLKTSKSLYLTGFTNEYETLEKVFYKIQTLNNQVCKGFDERRGTADKKSSSSAYVCGYAPHSAVNCQWDDGMALVSNNTGIIILEGLSLYGPGCSAPARYIQLHSYMSWIELVTGHEGEWFATPQPQAPLTRRRDQFEYIPVQKLYKSIETRRKEDMIHVTRHDFLAYVSKGKLNHYTISPIETDNQTLAIYRFEDMHEQFDGACQSRRTLMYREQFHLRAPDKIGDVTYKLSLYDLKNMVCICVTLSVHSINRTKAVLEFREDMDFMDGTEDLTEMNSHNIYKQIPIITRTEKPKNINKKPNWLTLEKFKPEAINVEYRKGTVLTNVLYVRIKFNGEARLNFKMFAYADGVDDLTTLRPEETTVTESSWTSTDYTTTPYLWTTTLRGLRYSEEEESEHFWGMHQANRMYKEEFGPITADIVGTVGAGSRSLPAPVVMALECFLIIVSWRTDLFIN